MEGLCSYQCGASPDSSSANISGYLQKIPALAQTCLDTPIRQHSQQHSAHRAYRDGRSAFRQPRPRVIFCDPRRPISEREQQEHTARARRSQHAAAKIHSLGNAAREQSYSRTGGRQQGRKSAQRGAAPARLPVPGEHRVSSAWKGAEKSDSQKSPARKAPFRPLRPPRSLSSKRPSAASSLPYSHS